MEDVDGVAVVEAVDAGDAQFHVADGRAEDGQPGGLELEPPVVFRVGAANRDQVTRFVLEEGGDVFGGGAVSGAVGAVEVEVPGLGVTGEEEPDKVEAAEARTSRSSRETAAISTSST